MHDIAGVLDRWLDGGGEIALSTVVETWGSGPRRPGARMTVDSRDRIAGSVSGGCVEGAVVRTAREVIRTGEPELLRFAVANETAWDVGLSCGGRISIFVERPDREAIRGVREAMAARVAVSLAAVVEGPGRGRRAVVTDAAGVGDTDVAAVGREALEQGRPLVRETPAGRVFADVILPPDSLVIVGGVHIAQTLAVLARAVGYRVAICDPRPVFGSAERFPGVELVNDWPEGAFERIGLDAGTAVATLTHDPKLDDPALAAALGSPAFYVGALGSRRTHAKRRKRLLDRGVREEDLERIAAPIGLPIGARTPDQIALAVMAQVVASRNRRGG